jgi:predicted GNAT family acetyltransferase
VTDALAQAPVRDNADKRCYEIVHDGRAAVAAYTPAPTGRVFTHTEVPAEWEGQGVGSRLVKGALDDCRARGLSVTPICTFVAGYIERHPEYQDLLLPTFRRGKPE